MHRLYKSVMFAFAATVSLGIAVGVHAKTGAVSPGDEAAVRAASKEFLAAARRGDENALRKMLTPEGDFVDSTGRVLKAGELIRQLAASPSPASGAAADSVSETTLRFITPDIAVEDGVADRAAAGAGGITIRRFTAVWAKRDGKWLLDSLREASVEASPLNEHLKPLEWLLGEWVATTDDTAILVSSHWCDGGNYIMREFIVAHDGGEMISGTQRIGWDPLGGQIKSWTFDSQGGSGEERWLQDGKRWLVETTDITADGKKGKTSSIFVPANERCFTWEVASADIGGANLKPVRVEFRRAAEDK
jgi:uncharacterized protein (TIGR02246 family)